MLEFLRIDAGRQNQHFAKRLRGVMRSIGGWTYKRGLRIRGHGTMAGYLRDGAPEIDNSDPHATEPANFSSLTH